MVNMNVLSLLVPQHRKTLPYTIATHTLVRSLYILPLFAVFSVVSKPGDDSKQLFLGMLVLVVSIWTQMIFALGVREAKVQYFVLGYFYCVWLKRMHRTHRCDLINDFHNRFLGQQADVSRQDLLALLVKWTGALVLSTCCAKLPNVRGAADSRAVPIGQSGFHGFVAIHVDWGRREVKKR